MHRVRADDSMCGHVHHDPETALAGAQEEVHVHAAEEEILVGQHTGLQDAPRQQRTVPHAPLHLLQVSTDGGRDMSRLNAGTHIDVLTIQDDSAYWRFN